MHEFYHIHSFLASDAEPAAGGGLQWGCAQSWTKPVPGGKSSRDESLLPPPGRGAARGAGGSGGLHLRDPPSGHRRAGAWPRRAPGPATTTEGLLNGCGFSALEMLI